MSRDPFLTVLGALISSGAVRLHNARGGFACNSSSSHSIVVLPDGLVLDPDLPDGDDYGWEDFALTDAGEKIRYLAAMVRHSRVATDALTDLREAHGVQLSRDAVVDHQSQLTFPHDFHGDDLDVEFLTDLAGLLADPSVAVLGGNDNGGESVHLRDDMVALAFDGYAGWRARKDTVDGQSWWVLFNDRDGTKVRVSFDPAVLRGNAVETPRRPRWDASVGPQLRNPAPFTPAKAGAPELVDVKLTDACAYEKSCSWCYMGSTVDGAAGDPVRVASLLAALAEQKVFEVAFGGGEPTLWPAFGQTLAYARTLGIVPNFTTKNYTWLTGPHAADWLDLVGSVAFSVNTATAMDRLTKKADTLSGNQTRYSKITVQLIPDLVPADDFTHILTQAATRGWRVTLLGYKDVGRGGDFTPTYRRDPGWWLTQTQKVAETHRLRSVAIDTALAVSSADVLADAGVPNWMYHLEEGLFSAYVDAVTGQVGPSSYAGPGSLTPLDLDADASTISASFAAAFATYTPAEAAPC